MNQAAVRAGSRAISCDDTGVQEIAGLDNHLSTTASVGMELPGVDEDVCGYANLAAHHCLRGLDPPRSLHIDPPHGIQSDGPALQGALDRNALCLDRQCPADCNILRDDFRSRSDHSEEVWQVLRVD